jgi:anti-sigma factor RsiW
VAQWVLGELPESESERFEAHYFECDVCLDRADRLQRLTEQLQRSLPPILTTGRRRALEAGRSRLPAVKVHPGERATIRLGPHTEMGLWVMQAPLAEVMRVDFEVRDPSGAVLFALADVPFDDQRGEVVLACQLHYRALDMPNEMHVRLTATGPSGSGPVGDYILNHEFETL